MPGQVSTQPEAKGGRKLPPSKASAAEGTSGKVWKALQLRRRQGGFGPRGQEGIGKSGKTKQQSSESRRHA